MVIGKVLEIGLDKNAAPEFGSPFAVAAPVVFYGTSLTQGGCANRPGMSYQAILGRQPQPCQPGVLRQRQRRGRRGTSRGRD
jgi:GDSL-like Lipase/Acylhydrolase family